MISQRGLSSFSDRCPRSRGPLESPGDFSKREACTLALFALAASFLLFFRLGAMDFVDPDEGRYALVGQEMWRHGNWFRATLNLVPYPDKPAPFFFLLGALLQLPADIEWSGRLVSVLPALGTLLFVLAWTRRHLGHRQAIWAFLVLATTGQFFVLSRIVRMDLLLLLALSAALFAAYRLINEETGRWWSPYVWGALGLLVKGPVAAALIGIVLVPYAFLSGVSRSVRVLRPRRGFVLLAAISGAWYLPALIADPAGMKSFIFEHNVGRFLNASVGHPERWYFFLWVLPACFMPWSLFLPATIRRSLGKVRQRSEPHLFLVIWCVAITLFFSLSRAKLAPYILPIFPPLAILTADAIAFLVHRAREGGESEVLPKLTKVWVSACAAASALALAVALVGPALGRPLLLALALLFLLSAGAHAAALSWKRTDALPFGIFATAAMAFLLSAAGGPRITNELASLRKAAASAAALPPGTRLYAYKTRGYSLSFYSGKRITQLNTAAKAAGLLDRSEPRAILIKRRHLDRVQQALRRPAAIWWRGASHKVLLANRWPPEGYTRQGVLLPAKGGDSSLVRAPKEADALRATAARRPAGILGDLLGGLSRALSHLEPHPPSGRSGPR